MNKRTGFVQPNISIWIIICITIVISMLPRGAYCQKSQSPSSEYEKNWPRFRGPGGGGVSFYSNIPVSWNGKTGEGVLWKTAIPLPGMNSPVVWGNRIFLTGANKQTREVYCFDSNSGNLLWRRVIENIPFSKPPSEDISEDTGYAASTAATDGQYVFAIFANGDITCFDFFGNQLWELSVGPLDNMYGHASSLVVHRNLLLIQLDQARTQDKLSKLVAIEGSSGKIVWEKQRPVPNSWATPIVINTGQREEIITCGNPYVIAYEPATRKELWRVKCLGGDVAPSPIYSHGLVYAIKAYESLTAIRPNGQGDVTKTHIAWTVEGVMPDICSPVANGDLLFVLESNGIVACYEAGDGNKVWEKNLRKTFLASPSLVSDNVYLMAEDGMMIVIKAARKYIELGRSELGEKSKASPAFQDGRIYIRGSKYLYCIAQ